jgi:hypothetical protein
MSLVLGKVSLVEMVHHKLPKIECVINWCQYANIVDGVTVQGNVLLPLNTCYGPRNISLRKLMLRSLFLCIAVYYNVG